MNKIITCPLECGYHTMGDSWCTHPNGEHANCDPLKEFPIDCPLETSNQTNVKSKNETNEKTI